jgi:ATP-binding cassette subfamily B protein
VPPDLVKLLTRLYDPAEGEIVWDGIDIRRFDPVELRLHMSVVFQDFTHYELSVQENIGLGDLQHVQRREYVREAAILAGVDEVIQKLPRDYNTVLSRWLSEDGVGIDLSGGEWQKIAIARAFMRHRQADLLILHEPTASIDAQAEHEIYSRFVELIKGRTTLLISHRFSTVRMADIIAVLDNGQVTEYGTHDELILLRGSYSKLDNMQAKQYH